MFLFPLFDHNPTKRFPLLTILLIVLNTVVFVQSLRLTPADQRELFVARGFIPKRLSEVNGPAPIEVVLTDAQGRGFGYQVPVDGPGVYATLLTMMFLHGGWLHLIANMWMLWVFGNNIEDRLGRLAFLGLYLLGGVLGTLAQWAATPELTSPVVGASGAVWAVLGAYALTYPWARVKTLVLLFVVPLLLETPALLVILFFFCFDALMAFSGFGEGQVQAVAHWAHLGGCVAGVTLMPLLAIGAAPVEADWLSEERSLLATTPPLTGDGDRPEDASFAGPGSPPRPMR